jgi:hypothetical protein
VALVAAAWLLMLFAPVRAEAVPSVSFTCSPAPQDCSGWYRSNVSIDWTVLPSGSVVAGCRDKTFTTDNRGDSRVLQRVLSTLIVSSTVTVAVPSLAAGRHRRGAGIAPRT